MPIDIGLIIDFHYREAQRHKVWAEEADEDGNLSQANYHRALSQRYLEAAEQQKRDALTLPGHAKPGQVGGHWPMIQPRRPFIAVCVTGILRGAGQLAGAIQQALPRRDQSTSGLTLH